MLRFLPILLLAAACGQQEQSEAGKSAPAAQAPLPTPAAAMDQGGAPMKSEPLMAVPADKAQLDRLLALGYTVHEDHMHKPGVAACPKMSDDMVR